MNKSSAADTADARAGEEFTLSLAEHLSSIPLPAGLSTELDLEKLLRRGCREFTTKHLCLRADDLDSVVYSHGDTRQDKPLWTRSKPLQNVIVYGCPNTSDIFIVHPKVGSIYVEVKLSRGRGRSASSLPGDLQRSIGQSLIASLRHPYVICFIGVQAGIRPRDGDLGTKLREMLWRMHRVALVVKPITGAS